MIEGDRSTRNTAFFFHLGRVFCPLTCLLSKHIKIKIFKCIILPAVLYGYETWSLTLREKHRLQVSENRVLRRIFGPMRDEIIGGWRKLHNEELHNLYSSPNMMRLIKSRKMGWAGHVACMGEKLNAYRILVGSQKEKDH
jgi:hypothetical protein